MKAVVRHAYGGVETLEFGEVAQPDPGPEEVLVRVVAAGVDRGVWHLMTGLPYLVRLAGFGVRRPQQPVLGMDLAGVVDQVGERVTRFAPGDEVFGIATGSFAEYARAREDKLTARPTAIGFTEAATLGVSGLAALQAVRDHGRVQPGERVLILGASGGVGSLAVQVAKAYGAHVTGVGSASKADLVASLGADEVVDYARQDVTASGRQWDVVLDVGGNRRLRALRRALTPTGRLVIVGGEGGDRWIGGVDRQLRALLLSPFVSQSLGTFISSENGGDLAVLADMVTDGRLRAAVEATFPLADAPAAIEHVSSGRARGKVALTV